MILLDNLEALGARGCPLVLAAGSFDGLHLGHAALLQAARREAAALQGETWVLTFEPHVMKVLFPLQAPRLLTSFRHKTQLLDALGVRGCVALPFTPEFAAMEPHAFLKLLRAKLPNLQTLVVGEDWTFGREGKGTVELLQEISEHLGLKAIAMPHVRWQGRPISSTRIRLAIEAGKLEDAAAMLGRPFSVLGRVIPGRQFGRTIGFPTANVLLEGELHPPAGVYAAQLICNGQTHQGAAFRPDPDSETTRRFGEIMEIHLFDFSGDLYDAQVELALLKYIRPNRRFDSAAALRAQIAADVDGIRIITG